MKKKKTLSGRDFRGKSIGVLFPCRQRKTEGKNSPRCKCAGDFCILRSVITNQNSKPMAKKTTSAKKAAAKKPIEKGDFITYKGVQIPYNKETQTATLDGVPMTLGAATVKIDEKAGK